MNKLTESRTRHFETASADFRECLVHFALGFTYLFRAAKHLFTGLALSFIFIMVMPAKGFARTFNTIATIDTTIDLADWDSFDECVATNTVATDWASNTLDNLYVTWDGSYLYVAINGSHEAANEIIVFIDRDYGVSSGANARTDFLDILGTLDATIDGSGAGNADANVTWTDTDFNPDFAVGWPVDADDATKNVRIWNPAAGSAWSTGALDGFGWYATTSFSADSTTGDYEVKISSADIYGTTTRADKKIAILVTLGNDSYYSNQFLPENTAGASMVPIVFDAFNSQGELKKLYNPAKNLPGRNSVVISEVFYNDNLTTDIDDWVELYNAANYSISLNNWKMRAWDEAMTTVYDMKLPNVSISSGTWLLVHPKAGTDRTNYWGIKEVYKGSNEDWFGTGAGTCELYNSSYTITAKTIVDFFVWDYDGTLAAVDVDSCAVTANIWVDGTFFDGGTASTNQSIERIDNSSETYKHPSPISAFDDDVAPCASEGVDNNGDDSPTSAGILGVVTTTSDFVTNTKTVTEGTTVYFKINVNNANASYQQAVICKATSTSDQTGIFVTARENGISSNDYQGLIKLTLTSPSTSAMDALWAPAGDMITVRTLVNAVYYDTVTVTAGANNAPDAPTKFGQYLDDWTAINWGAWTNYQVMRASFTLTDPDTDDKLQFNIQISSHSDYSFCYINSTAPATAVLDEGTTNFLTTRAVALIPEGTWYWRVKATDDDGATGAYASSDTANDYHFRVDVSTPNNVGCSTPADGAYNLDTSTALTALTASDSLSGVWQYSFEVSTAVTFDKPGDIASGWTTSPYSPPGLAQDTTYYWRVKARDNVSNESVFCGEADTAGYRKFITAAKTVDGDPSDWGTYSGAQLDNSSRMDGEEWVWKDKEWDERTDVNIVSDDHFEFNEWRMWADSTDIFFLVRFTGDITNTKHPYIAISVDTNTTSAGMNWTADDSGVLMGAEYGRLGDTYHNPEHNIIVHHTNSASLVQIEQWKESAGTWAAPDTYGGGACNFSDANEVAEFKIARSDIGLNGNKTARFTFSLYCSTGIGDSWANNDDTTYNVSVCDALDTMSIIRMSTGSNTYNDNNGSMNAYNEDIDDNDIDFWTEISFDANGFVTNNKPTAPTTAVSPVNGSATSDLTPVISWSGATDADGATDITSYLLIIDNEDALSIPHTYKVNVSTTGSFTVPSNLTPDTTYYWRVYTRDKSGDLSGVSARWSFYVKGRTIDGSITDWGTVTAGSVNESTVDSAKDEWIWRDKLGEERIKSTDPNSNFDIDEIRITANDTYIYFLIKSSEITGVDIPHFAISIDTDCSLTDTERSWIDDDSNSNTEDGGSMGLGTDYSSKIRAERNIVICSTAAGWTGVLLFADDGSTWYTPPSGDWAAYMSDANNIVEVKIKRSDIGLDGVKTFKFALTSADNIVANPEGADTTAYYTPDALDAMNIVRISSGSGTGQYHSDPANDLNAWDEEISDTDIDFWAEVRLAADGIISNTAPSKPSNPTPAHNGKYSTDAKPALSWGAASDSDSGDYVTSYMIEFATHTDLGSDLGQAGEYGYRVNIASAASPSWTIPNDLKNDVTYYWRVFSRDACGALSSSPDIWAVKVDSVAPAAVTNLSALTGTSGGEVKLTWTAPGDNDLSDALPAGSSFRIKYSSESTHTWDTMPYTVDISTAVSAGTICSRTIGGLIEGAEYYFYIRTADEIPNWSALSNKATACAYVTPPPDSGAMCVYFSTPTAVANFPQYRTLTEATTIWSSVASASDAGAAVQYWHILKNSPAANEKILVTLDGDQDVNTQRWDGSSWSAAIEHTSAAGTYATRVVDGCYEHSSGDFLIVYRNGAAATPQYKTLAKGGSWSAAADVPNYALTGVPTWIRLESRLGSDSILLAAQDANADLFAMLWDGSNWLSVSSATLTTSLSHADQCWDIACEYQSGNFMITYGTPTVSVKYRRLLAGTTSWEAEGSLTNADAAVCWVKLASEKKANSNYIICGNLDDGNDLDVQVWDGSSWGASVEVSAGVVSDAKRAFDVEWEAASSQKGIVVYGQSDSQMPRYGTISGAVVSDIDGSALDVDDVTSNEPDTLKLMPDPDSDDIWLIYSVGHTASTATICAQRWQGIAANAWDGAKKLTKISYESAPYENFSIAYGIYTAPPSADNTPPSAVSNLTAIAGTDDGEVKLTWTAPGDDGAGGNVSSGLYRINAATYNITSANFGSITNNGKYTFTVDISTSYTTQGTEHSYGFSGLYPGTTYYFAIKLRDESNNWSSWSDTASSSDTAPAQDLAPPAPTNLNVQPGENKITLIWTEVSGEPDLDYYKIYRDSSTPYDYADAYTIEVDTGNSSYLNTGLSNTVTYYYKMTVFDLGDSGNGLFSHARESAFSNEKSTRPLAEMPTPEAFLTYYSSSTTQSLNETPQCGSWNGSLWASGYDVKRITQTATGWYVVKKCPTAAKWLFGIQDSAKVLNVMIYDESTKAWSAPKKLATISNADRRGFDIEFEQQSGRALVVYEDKDVSAQIPRAITWTDSGGWGEAFSITMSTNGTGTVVWVELVPKPNSNDMVLGLGYTATNSIFASMWFSTSTNFGSSIGLEFSPETSGQQCFDGAYEMQSGDAMVAWTPSAGNIKYRIYSSGWGAEQAGPQGIGATIYWVKLAANPNNDAIILGTLDGATPYDVNVSTWNGSNWGTTTEVTPSASVYTTRPFDIAWETASGDGLVVFNDGTSVPKARRLSAGAWGADIPASDVGGAPCCAQLAPDNNSDDILLVTCNDAATPDIHAQKWDGAANSFGSATLITNNSSNKNGSAYSHNFAAAYPYVQPTDNTTPAAITTLSASSTTTTGEIRLEWEAPGDNDWSGTLGTYDNNAQFRIQYATYTAFAFGDHTTYDVSIDTYSVNPYDVQSKLITLSKETTYYFRIWTRDELSAGNWSGISYGATCWVRIAPAAITALSSLAEDDGDVQLSWIAPGDDGTTGAISDGQWKIRYSTISTVDWTTASAGWTDEYDKYEFLIDTSCAALSERAKTLTGLHGGVTYYFRIWTRDEATGINAPGNWSEISNGSTACVVKIIGISVSTNTYNFGEVNLSGSSVTASGITVKNTGNVFEDYSMRVSSITLFDSSPSVWKSTDTTVGYNRFILYGIFHGARPESAYFVVQDTVTAVNQTSGDERYTYDGSQKGATVPKQEERTLWLRLDMPTTVYTSKQEKITVTITAGESP